MRRNSSTSGLGELASAKASVIISSFTRPRLYRCSQRDWVSRLSMAYPNGKGGVPASASYFNQFCPHAKSSAAIRPRSHVRTLAQGAAHAGRKDTRLGNTFALPSERSLIPPATSPKSQRGVGVAPRAGAWGL